MPGCISDAFCCTATVCSCSDYKCGYGRKSEWCCLVEECCLSCGEEALGCGVVTNSDNKECCKIACAFCACGLKKPQRCCSVVEYFCCVKGVTSFPFTRGYIEKCHCAFLFISCAPECGCCLEPSDCAALDADIKDYSYLMQTNSMER